jgi:hypothetical protein
MRKLIIKLGLELCLLNLNPILTPAHLAVGVVKS